MKREGRQHGTVRTYCILSPNLLNPTKPALRKATPALGSPPTAGIFTRVSTKPTNHSKFTGKCGRPRCTDCHLHPSWKSKDKIKGARKLRATDMDVGYGGLLAWRVTGKAQGRLWPDYKMKLDTYSAHEILEEFVSGDDHEYDDDHHYYYDRDYSYYDHKSRYISRTYDDNASRYANVSMNLDCLVEYPFISSPIARVSREINEDEDEDESANGFGEIDVVVGDGDEDEDDDMGGFYDVAIVWEAIDGDEGWALIGEM